MFQMAVISSKWPKYVPNGHKIYLNFPFQGPPKFTKIGIFGMKIYHLASLVDSGVIGDKKKLCTGSVDIMIRIMYVCMYVHMYV
jgi:hypothetical protein